MEKNKNRVYIILFIVTIGLALVTTVITYIIGNKNETLKNVNYGEKKNDIDTKNNIANDTKDNNEKDNNNEETAIELSNSVIDIQKYVTLSDIDNDYKRYTIDMNSVYVDNGLSGKSILEEYNIVLQYKIDNYEIKLKLADNNYPGTTRYNLYVNDNFIYDDYGFLEQCINVDMLGKYLIFSFNGGTDIRSLIKYVANNNGLLLKIYELDNNSGMVPRTITINNNGIVVEGTRMTHNETFIYEGEFYELLIKENCESAIAKFGKDLLIRATYTYRYLNGALDLNPQISNKIRLDEYINKNNLCNK